MLSVESIHQLHPELKPSDISFLFACESDEMASVALDLLSEKVEDEIVQTQRYQLIERAIQKLKEKQTISDETETQEFQAVELPDDEPAFNIQTDTSDFEVAALVDRLTLESIENEEGKAVFNELTTDEKWARLFGDYYLFAQPYEQEAAVTAVKTILGHLMNESDLFCNYERNDERYFTLIRQLVDTDVSLVITSLQTLGSPHKQGHLSMIITLVASEMRVPPDDEFYDQTNSIAIDLFEAKDANSQKSFRQIISDHLNQ